jgi:CMP/dCMP kinase
VALLAMREGVPATAIERLVTIARELEMVYTEDNHGDVRIAVNGEDVTALLSSPNIGQIASIVGTIPGVREHLVAKQRALGSARGVVMEGRDIQTIVFPDADLKVFLTASAEERARRRWNEITAGGSHAAYAQVLADVRARDARDEARAASPLCAASDAAVINTDGRTLTQVVDAIVALVPGERAGGAAGV